VLYGHTHQQVVRRIGGLLVINPGHALTDKHLDLPQLVNYLFPFVSRDQHL